MQSLPVHVVPAAAAKRNRARRCCCQVSANFRKGGRGRRAAGGGRETPYFLSFRLIVAFLIFLQRYCYL